MTEAHFLMGLVSMILITMGGIWRIVGGRVFWSGIGVVAGSFAVCVGGTFVLGLLFVLLAP